MTDTPQASSAASPAAMSTLNKSALVIGALGLVAIGALAAVLLMGPQAPPAMPPPMAMVESGSTPATAAPSEGPAAAVALAKPPTKVSHMGKSQQAAAPAPTVAQANPPSVVQAPVPAEAATVPAQAPEPVKAICGSCGAVTSVAAIERKGEGSGLGAVAGGVLGGIIGHQTGGGRGKDAMTLLGAIGGGMAGNEVEKRQRAVTEYQIRVRMDDGGTRSFTNSQVMSVGQRVLVEGDRLSLDNASAGGR
jgi:outer membrane lipoprotein SlyB